MSNIYVERLDAIIAQLELSRSYQITRTPITLTAAVPVYHGRFVTVSGSGGCGHASAAHPLTAAIGYVNEDYGVGQPVLIWRDGDVMVTLPGQDAASLMMPVYLSGDGLVTRTMPLEVGGIVQTLGVIMALGDGDRVRIAVLIGNAEEIM